MCERNPKIPASGLLKIGASSRKILSNGKENLDISFGGNNAYFPFWEQKEKIGKELTYELRY